MESSIPRGKLFSDCDVAKMQYIVNQFGCVIKTIKQTDKLRSINLSSMADKSFITRFAYACTVSEAIADRIESVWSSILKRIVAGNACCNPHHGEARHLCRYHEKIHFCFKRGGSDLYEALGYPPRCQCNNTAFEEYWAYCFGKFLRIILPHRESFPKADYYIQLWIEVGASLQTLWMYARSEKFCLKANNDGVCLFKKAFRKHEDVFSGLTMKYRSVTPSVSHFSIVQSEKVDMTYSNESEPNILVRSSSANRSGEAKVVKDSKKSDSKLRSRKRALERSFSQPNEKSPLLSKRSAPANLEQVNTEPVNNSNHMPMDISNTLAMEGKMDNSEYLLEEGKSGNRSRVPVVTVAAVVSGRTLAEVEIENEELRRNVQEWKLALDSNEQDFKMALTQHKQAAMLEIERRDAAIASLQSEIEELRARKAEIVEK